MQDNDYILDKELCGAAIEASSRAVCPYSRFHVGAAIRTWNDKIVKGCNIENASYGLTICAERTAIFACLAMGERPKKIAVACPDNPPNSPNEYFMPCGACRQVMAEFFPDDAEVHIAGVGVRTVRDLLPEAFRL